jgi:hypothetical protein
MKIEIAEDEAPLITRALERYASYLRATNRTDSRYEQTAERLKKPPASETVPEQKRKRIGK